MAGSQRKASEADGDGWQHEREGPRGYSRIGSSANRNHASSRPGGACTASSDA